MGDKNRKPDNGFRNPNNLPTKICAGCGKRFTWRKKWEHDWGAVRFCSDACRNVSPRAASHSDDGDSNSYSKP